MKIQVSAKNLHVNEDQWHRIERRLYFALGRFASRVGSVELVLGDENGPRGGIDKRCRVIVRLNGCKDVLVEGRGDDVDSLVDRTVGRAGRAVSRALDLRKHRSSRSVAGWREEDLSHEGRVTGKAGGGPLE